MHPLQLPETVDALIQMLDIDPRCFRLRNLPADTDYAAMQRHFGARDVVDFLRSLQRDRDDNAMERLHQHNSINGR
jgi:hypothetical protein